MKLISKIFFIVFFISLAQAKKEEAAEVDCATSEMLNKSHLSCIVCGLKKIGRPVPDENYLGMVALMARENAALFTDEQNPKSKHNTRRDLKYNQSQIVDSGSGPVEFTARMQYQKAIIQMIMASGYCAQGKIKPKVKDNTYSNFIKRINSDKHPIAREERKVREKATEELGFDDWDNTKYDFWMKSSNTESFFSLPFEKQKEFYRGKRISKFQSTYDDSGYRPRSEISDCLNDIDSNYMSTYATPEKSYEACTAIYDSCEIATTPYDGQDGGREIHRLNANKEKVRVGGDWCGTKYKVTANSIASTSGDKNAPNSGIGPSSLKDSPVVAAEKAATKTDGTPLAPVEDKSIRSIGNGWYLSHDGKIFNNDPKKIIDPSKITYKNGTIEIDANAYKPAPAPIESATRTPGQVPPK